jgi:uncharacterized membrane protein YhhN
MIAWAQGMIREVRWLVTAGLELSQEISTNE